MLARGPWPVARTAGGLPLAALRRMEAARRPQLGRRLPLAALRRMEAGGPMFSLNRFIVIEKRGRVRPYTNPTERSFKTRWILQINIVLFPESAGWLGRPRANPHGHSSRDCLVQPAYRQGARVFESTGLLRSPAGLQPAYDLQDCTVYRSAGVRKCRRRFSAAVPLSNGGVRGASPRRGVSPLAFMLSLCYIA